MQGTLKVLWLANLQDLLITIIKQTITGNCGWISVPRFFVYILKTLLDSAAPQDWIHLPGKFITFG